MFWIALLLALILWAILDREGAGRWIVGALSVALLLAVVAIIAGLGAFGGYWLMQSPSNPDAGAVGGWLGGIGAVILAWKLYAFFLHREDYPQRRF